MNIEAKKKEIDQEVKSNKVVLYMKGTKHAPQCGFSAQIAHILNTSGVNYLDRDVLSDPELREAIKHYSDWPTIPQLYIDGEFIGGCDIAVELSKSGELQKLLG